MRVKLFWTNDPVGPRKFGFSGPATTAANARELEDSINSWLAAQTDIKVTAINQSASGGSYGPSLWLISVWYEEGT